MRKFLLLFAGAAFVAFMNSCNTSESASDEVQIGNQIWMTKNLNVEKFRNGDPIPEAKTTEEWINAGKNGQPAWCWHSEDKKKECGRIYNFYAVSDKRNIAPTGWSVPSKANWETLREHLGADDLGDQGYQLKSNDFWPIEKKGNDKHGFRAIPTGGRHADGEFVGFKQYCAFWSFKEDIQKGCVIVLPGDARYISIIGEEKESCGFPLRLLHET
jgi:uncharacterized protein (TIGR02145 family)